METYLYVMTFMHVFLTIEVNSGQGLVNTTNQNTDIEMPLLDNQDLPLVAKFNTAALNKAIKMFINKKSEQIIVEKMKTVKQEVEKEIVRSNYPKDCEDLGPEKSGVYKIFPNDVRGFNVYCDMETNGGGWIVFQRRFDGTVNFYRNWKDYKNGFGNITGEYWLGNINLHQITSADEYELHIALEDFKNETKFARYDTFFVGDVRSRFALTIGGFTGNAGDSLSYHNSQPFVTKDRDNSKRCAQNHKGAWWYNACLESNLNGMYLRGTHGTNADGVAWLKWKGNYYSLKKSKMMLRRRR